MSGGSSADALELAGGYARKVKKGRGGQAGVLRKVNVSRRTHEAVFKLKKTHASTRASARNMVDYISRDGDLELLDQDGNPVQHDDERKSLIDDWSMSFSERAKPRVATHMILSTPIGSDIARVKKASAEWGRANLSEYDYVQVTHTDEPHPHTHFIVARRPGGPSLSFGPSDIIAMKDSWAEIGTKNKIPMVSSSRAERGIGRKSLRQRDIHIRNRDGYTRSDLSAAAEVLSEAKPSGGNPWDNAMQERLVKERSEYEAIAKNLERLANSKEGRRKRVEIEATLKLVKRQAMALREVKTRRDIMRSIVDNPKLAVTIKSSPEALAKEYAKGDLYNRQIHHPDNDKKVRAEFDKLMGKGLYQSFRPQPEPKKERSLERERDRDRDRDF